MQFERNVVVDALGSAGDGIARDGDNVFYIPYAIPGESWTLTFDDKGRLTDRKCVERSSDGAAPACTLFGLCGGCAIQRMPLSDILAWKVSRVRSALAASGFNPGEPLRVAQSAPGKRRRVDLAAQKTAVGVTLGLHRRFGAPVDMVECPLIDSRLYELLGPLRDLIRRLGCITREADVDINLFDSGPDIVLRNATAPEVSDRKKLADFANTHQVARISWLTGRASSNATPEVVAQLRPVKQVLSDVAISPPPSAFMQATADGEAAIVQAVCDALPRLNKRDVIMELYAGIGTLTVPLSGQGRVEAYEGHASSISALDAARAGRRITCTVRDLSRQPLLEKDLQRSRVVVLDPPRQGAGGQAARIAAARVRDVVYVSCNPSAMRDDLTFFQKQGYRLLDWSVIDQFIWATDVESVVALTLDKKRVPTSLV